ncbi:SMI1/KNR4 family protein [Streptomyces sp. NPDC088354]|uniref:SMI1/KNR4 family protein n=1 Tax=Streptomyces sp. NPDC088354 TaxID=3365856 RepID=UPI003810840F
MTDTAFDWRSFLVRWSEEWADAQDPDDSLSEDDAAAVRDRWLGFAPADAERIALAEERLGRRLPPSYRAFLEVSDGWRHAGRTVPRLVGAEGTRWFEDASGFADIHRVDPDEVPSPQDVVRAGMWGRALHVNDTSDAVHVLMDPGDTDEDGEWAVSCFDVWSGHPPTRYASFRDFMEGGYRAFHRSSVIHSARGGGEFANSTTRALDAAVEDARRDALGGRYERAETALREAEEYGRPGAEPLRAQIRRLLVGGRTTGLGGPALDPVYAHDLLALLAAEHVRDRRDDASWESVVRDASGEVRTLGQELLRSMREETFRYTAPGAFGEAVDRAWEQARWGGTDEAWRTLRAALPDWEPAGPALLAPLGLLADPVLGPLITPERGEELLATPRAGEAGVRPQPAADADPAGLLWLPSTMGNRRGYRFVLVEGAPPDALPGLLGTEGDDGLLRGASRTNSRSMGATRMAAGSAGGGWCFAFDGLPPAFDEARFVSPAAAASRAGRAVVVWGCPGGAHGSRSSDLFHLSVAEKGEESYAFTVHGTGVRRSGSVPPDLDPGRLFCPEDFPREGELRALGAIAAAFGVTLPRFALTRSRLPTFTTHAWTRPPGPDDGQVTVTAGRG